MLTVEEARERVLERFSLLATEKVGLLDAIGRVLAEDVVSDIDVAPFDNSAMDGYAVRAVDTTDATEETPVVLRVIEHLPAGSWPRNAVGPGEATRIMTGAPMPSGADAVVMVERTRGEELEGGAGGTVAILKGVAVGENVRRKGEDVRAGDVVLAAGEVVTAAAVGLMAAVGCAEPIVYRRPRVGIVSTGDELVRVEETPGLGQIRNSNSYSLAAQVLAAGGEPHMLGIARDTEEDTRALLGRAGEFDVLVSTGGVSMGDFDVVKTVLEQIGDLEFWTVAMRPGAPQTFGSIDGTPFFGLPGNPTSCMVGFELFVRPGLRKMQGHSKLERPRVTATLEHDVRKKQGRRYFLRARLRVAEGGGYSVALSGSQSSALLTAMHHANCLMSLPADATEFAAGESVECIRLDVEEGTP